MFLSVCVIQKSKNLPFTKGEKQTRENNKIHTQSDILEL
jgi:hypothetical protein